METVQIERKKLIKIKERLEGQRELFLNPDFLKELPLTRRPQMALERRSLKKLIKYLDEVLQ